MLGVIIFTIGIAKSTKNLKRPKKFLIIFLTLLSMVGLLTITDYINIKFNNDAPRFRWGVYYIADGVYYDRLLFYDVVKCDKEYYIVKNEKYSDEKDFNWCEKD